MLENYKIRYLSSLIFIFSWLMLYLLSSFSYIQELGYFSTIFLIFMGIWLIVRSLISKNTLFLLFFAFIFLYTLPPYSYYFKGIYLSAHNPSFTYESTNMLNLIFSLFLVVLNCFLKIPPTKELPKLKFESNSLIYLVLYAVSVLIVITSRRKGNVYNVVVGESSSMSSLNEYVLILFALLYIYSNRTTLYTYMNFALYLLYAFFALIAGGRVEVVLLFMMLFTIRYSQTISFRKTIIIFIIGAWGMTVFGTIRSNPRILLTGDVMAMLNPFAETQHTLNSLNSNEGDVYWASERMILLKEEGYLPLEKRALATSSFFLSVIAPSSIMPDEAVLSSYRQDIRNTGGGGLAPAYFYIFFGLFGVVLLGWFVAYILNGFKNGVSQARYFYTLFFIVTLPRWIAYTPIQLIKLCVWAVFIFFIIKSIDYTIKKYYVKNISLPNN